jgi:Vitamin K-dependent gamma-carboxylase, lumenal domain
VDDAWPADRLLATGLAPHFLCRPDELEYVLRTHLFLRVLGATALGLLWLSGFSHCVLVGLCGFCMLCILVVHSCHLCLSVSGCRARSVQEVPPKAAQIQERKAGEEDLRQGSADRLQPSLHWSENHCHPHWRVHRLPGKRERDEGRLFFLFSFSKSFSLRVLLSSAIVYAELCFLFSLSPTLTLSCSLRVIFLLTSPKVLMPFRHYTYPGDVAWNEYGHRFSWRMKLRDKNCDGNMFLVDKKSQLRSKDVSPVDFLTSKQWRKVKSRPDHLIQVAKWFVHFVF